MNYLSFLKNLVLFFLSFRFYPLYERGAYEEKTMLKYTDFRLLKYLHVLKKKTKKKKPKIKADSYNRIWV